MESEEAYNIQGQIEVINLMLAFTESMAVKCIVELRIPDIIHSHGSPISLSKIISKIGSPSLNTSYILRVMRFLVQKKVFSTTLSQHSGETLYDLTHSSRLLLHDAEMTMAPIFLMNTHPMFMEPWHHLSTGLKDDEPLFNKAYRSSFWELVSNNPELNNMYNRGLESTTKFSVDAILMAYKDGFKGIETLVDVGGGIGYMLSKIVKTFPHIRGINFDLQYVVKSAPNYPQITHVGGNMLELIPDADAIIMKSVLHNWSDDDCKKILRNCKRALSKTAGKLILVDVVVEPEGERQFDDIALKFDLLMMVGHVGGKERTELEWINLLKEVGFSKYRFIKIPALQHIIEAYVSGTDDTNSIEK